MLPYENQWPVFIFVFSLFLFVGFVGLFRLILCAVGMGFLVHFILPHMGRHHFALFVAGVADGMGHIVNRGERLGEALADDIGGIHDEEERILVDIFNQAAEPGDLGQVDDGKDNPLVRPGEGALPVQESRPVVDIAEDCISDFQRLVGYDEGRFSLGKADDETGGKIGADVHADEGADGRLKGENPCTGEDDDKIQRKDDVSDFQIVEFFQDGADYVQTAGIAVISVKNAHGNAEDNAAGDGGNHGVLDDFHLCQRGRKIDEQGNENRPQNRDGSIEFSDEFQGKGQDRDIQHQVRQADGNAGQVVNDHGDTGQAAGEEFVRHIKGIDAYGINEGADDGNGNEKQDALPEKGGTEVRTGDAVHGILRNEGNKKQRSKRTAAIKIKIYKTVTDFSALIITKGGPAENPFPERNRLDPGKTAFYNKEDFPRNRKTESGKEFAEGERNMKGKLLAAALFCGLAVFLSGCGTKTASGEGSAGYTVTDAAGREVVIPKKPEKILGTSAFIDTMLLGVVTADHLAGATAADRDPAISYIAEDTKDIPLTVPLMGAPAELIAQAKPDLIIASTYTKQDDLALYETMGIPVVVVKGPVNLEEVKESVRLIAAAAGEKERGERVVSRMEEKLAEADRVLSGVTGPRPKVYLISQMTRWGGPGSMYDELVTRARLDNAIGLAGARNGQSVSLEMLYKVDPDLFFVSTDRASDQTGAGKYRDAFLANPAVARMRAAQHVVPVPDKYIYSADQNSVYSVMAFANAGYGKPLFDLSDAKQIRGY